MIDFSQAAKHLPMRKAQWDEFFILQCLALTSRSDCTSRRFGAIIVNKTNRILSAGYNAPPCGSESAAQVFKKENTDVPDVIPRSACFKLKAQDNYTQNQGYDFCPALHAEQNAILDYGVRQLAVSEAKTIYIAGRDGQTGEILDSTPCIHCARMIKQAQLSNVVYLKKDNRLGSVAVERLLITPERQ